MGTAVTAVTSMIKQVPTHAERIPAWAGNREGKDVKNCGVRRVAPVMARSRIRAARVIIPTDVHKRPTIANMASRVLLRVTFFSASFILINLPEAFTKQIPTDVKEKRHAHQS